MTSPMTRPIEVLATDPETGELRYVECVPGDYVLVCAQPRYLASSVHYGNGTVVITLKLDRPPPA